MQFVVPSAGSLITRKNIFAPAGSKLGARSAWRASWGAAAAGHSAGSGFQRSPDRQLLPRHQWNRAEGHSKRALDGCRLPGGRRLQALLLDGRRRAAALPQHAVCRLAAVRRHHQRDLGTGRGPGEPMQHRLSAHSIGWQGTQASAIRRALTLMQRSRAGQPMRSVASTAYCRVTFTPPYDGGRSGGSASWTSLQAKGRAHGRAGGGARSRAKQGRCAQRRRRLTRAAARGAAATARLSHSHGICAAGCSTRRHAGQLLLCIAPDAAARAAVAVVLFCWGHVQRLGQRQPNTLDCCGAGGIVNLHSRRHGAARLAPAAVD